jgi:hypothetical protein
MPRQLKEPVTKPQDTIKNMLVHNAEQIKPKEAPKAAIRKD